MSARDGYLQRKYGITEYQYDVMLAMGHGACWLCWAVPKKLRLAVDHDHGTGRVRGLLCWTCNKRIVANFTAKHADIFARVPEYLRSTFDGRRL